ncbi:MAG: [protein-PII] uridylyltransferase [Planctomycetota bacterium]|nr:MAG: [protein-PII] uridylyltransferase [Planctomycetota bacterium]REK43488.1 MAG: [protein-PII] uridylyltransferase [Planctomycetota bacterium]
MASSLDTLAQHRQVVASAREQLQTGRERIRLEHERGTPGIQLCAQITELVDEVIVRLFEAALDDLAKIDRKTDDPLRDQVALVAHGGYGRRELAPYSDVDLMILHQSHVADRVAVLAERMMRDVFDVGLILGHSVRTVRQALSLVKQDPVILTSLTESRHVAGDRELTRRLTKRLRRQVMRRPQSYLASIENVRREERRQYGETIYLLQPNIKRTRGGLRDIQLLRWIGFCSYGVSEPRALRLQGALSHDEENKIQSTNEFLLQLRNELHFTTDKAHDRLDRALQLRVAEKLGYESTEGMLAVEAFMQDYFRRTREVRYIVGRFTANARSGSRVARLFGSLLGHHVGDDFHVGPYHIRATRRGLEKLKSSLSQIMRLAELANLYNRRIDHTTWETVREAAKNLPDEIDPETAARFMSLISQPAQLGELLRRMHELGVLEKFIPAFARARGLLQFNEYHQYTVDEHCIHAVERVAELVDDPGLVGRIYRGIQDKELLHLALLVHDLGKGYPEDHSECGLRIAAATAERLFLTPQQAEVVKFLTHKHLLMSHWGLRRDTSDLGVAMQLAREVGSPDVLRKLFVLTLADLAAVGPGVLNAWKIDLLTVLYEQTMAILSGDRPDRATQQQLSSRRDRVRQLVAPQPEADWYDELIESLTGAYLLQSEPEDVATDLQQLHQLQEGEVRGWGRYRADRGAVELTAVTHETVTEGIFHKLAGAISREGLEILSAQINTFARGLVLDRFYVEDLDYWGAPPEDRLAQVSRRLEAVLLDPNPKPPTFRRVWKEAKRDAASLSNLPVQVRFDNSSHPDYTIIDIFAPDRTGLLYTIARKLFDLELSVAKAKIATYLDQVVDVFYVTDAAGNKIEDAARLDEYRARLIATIEEFDRDLTTV